MKCRLFDCGQMCFDYGIRIESLNMKPVANIFLNDEKGVKSIFYPAVNYLHGVHILNSYTNVLKTSALLFCN